MAARFASEKGVEVLLDAMPAILEKYPNAQVLFAGQFEDVMGEHAYAERLMPRIREYQVNGNWKFLGILDPQEMAAFYPNLDVITVPSLNATEAFGLVQIEAMLNGVPSVPSALPGVRQPVLMHGMGCVSEIGDSASLASAILEVLNEADKFKGDPSEIARQYDPDTIAAEYEKLFARLMKRK
jgi:glycosyltransferase involved in cell wall biosynthesis